LLRRVYREPRIGCSHFNPYGLRCRAFVRLSNSAAREFDVSLGPDGGRKIFSKVRRVDELLVSWHADVQIGDVA
jgi:hypothetical protein